MVARKDKRNYGSCYVWSTDGHTVRRHADQLRSRPSGPITQTTSSDSDEDYDFDVSTQENSEPSLSESVADTSSATSAETETTSTNAGNNESSERIESSSTHVLSENATVETTPSLPSVRRSDRARNPPTYYGYDQSVSTIIT